MEVLKKLWGSRAVWVAGAGLLSTVLLEGSDGALTPQDVDKIIEVVKWLVTALITKWGVEDAAHKLPWQPPPAQPEPAKPVVTADHG